MKKNAIYLAGFFGAGCAGGFTGAHFYQRSVIPGILAEIKELPPGESKTFKIGEGTQFTYTKREPIVSDHKVDYKEALKEVLLTAARMQLKLLKGPVGKLSRFLLPKHISEGQTASIPTEENDHLMRVNYSI